MPGIIGPPHYKTLPTKLKKVGAADSGNARQDASLLGKIADAGRGWHDLNMALARSLPTSLLLAGQFEVATRRTLAHGRKRRR